MEKLWTHAFDSELRSAPDEHPVVLTEVPLNPRKNRAKTAEVMFETFGRGGLYIADQAVLSLCNAGRATGVVLEAGHSVPHAVPVYEFNSVPAATARLALGGRDVTDWLRKILYASGFDCSLRVERAIACDAKETLGYVALDFDAEMARGGDVNVSYPRPDGRTEEVGRERFRGPELLFRPRLDGLELDGVDQTVVDSIVSADGDIRREMRGNIVLGGGTTLFRGLRERLEKDVGRLAPPSERAMVRVVAPQNRRYSAWVGGRCSHSSRRSR
jgi:actin beta/gamma 1